MLPSLFTAFVWLVATASSVAAFEIRDIDATAYEAIMSGELFQTGVGHSELARRHIRKREVPTSISPFTINTAIDIINKYPQIEEDLGNNTYRTFFIPTDAAFNNLKGFDANYYNYIYTNDNAMVNFAEYHILSGRFLPPAVTNNPQRVFKWSLNKHRVRIDIEDGNIYPSSGLGPVATVVQGIRVKNGVVYIIDNVLIPPRNLSNLKGLLGVDEFISLIGNVGLADTFQNLSSITIFAPTDSAINALSTLINPINITASIGLASATLDLHLAPKVILTPNLIKRGISSNYRTSSGLPGERLTALVVSEEIINVYAAGRTDFVAKIVTADIIINNNNILHIIDQVLIPSDNTVIAEIINDNIVYPNFF